MGFDVSCVLLEASYESPAGLIHLRLFASVACQQVDSVSVTEGGD